MEASQRSTDLHVADLNSDGLPDIVTVANDKSVLELHVQDRSEEPPFRRQEVVLDQFVQGLATLDVDGDGRTDVITAGSPARLSWLRQGEDGVLSSPEKLDREAEDLASADLNLDKAPDLVCTNQKRIEIIPSGRRGLDWDNSQVYWSAYSIQGAPVILDLNNDGLSDLVFTEAQRNDRLIVRFQTPEGRFPEEATVATNGLSDLGALNHTEGRQTLLGILNKTETLEQMAWTTEEEQKGSAVPTSRAFGRIRTVAFDPESVSDRLVADWVPLAGGGIPCILVASPASPSLRLVRAARDGSLRVESVPSVTGATQILPVPPIKKGESWFVGLVSRTEKSLAFGRIGKEGDSVSFPQPMTLGGPPLTAAIADLGKGKLPDLAICRSQGDGTLVIEVRYDFNPQTLEDADETTFPLKGQEGDRPSGLLAVDLNLDDHTDFVALFEYADPVILLQKESGTWEALTTAEGMLEGLLTGVRAGNVLTAPLGPEDKPDLLIAKENYARAVHLDAENHLVIDQQFNARNTRSRLRAAIAARVTGPDTLSVILLDVGNQCLTLYHPAPKGETGFVLDRHIDIDEADYQSMLATDINEDEKDDILLLAPDRLTVLYSGTLEGHLETVAKAKTEVEDGGYGLVSADALLPGDEQQILVVEQTENVLECFLNEAQNGELRQFYRFKVFQGDQIRQRREAFRGQTEPREITTADLNDDGKPDLILLMHDVIGVYYQK